MYARPDFDCGTYNNFNGVPERMNVKPSKPRGYLEIETNQPQNDLSAIVD